MALDKNSYIIPSVLLSEAFYLSKEQPHFIASKVEHVIQDGFFRSIELPVINDAKDRKQIASALKTRNCLIKDVVIWATERLAEPKIDLNALDEKQRIKSVDEVKKILDYAKETGGTHVGINAGNNVGILQRSTAYQALLNSVNDIASYAQSLDLKVLLEPLDRFADKKKLLGSTRDAQELFGIITSSHKNVSLSLDTAHTALNREGLREALDLVAPYVEFIHLSNCVLDRQSPLYGDNHIMPGDPGFLTVKVAERMLQHAYANGIKSNEGLRVAIEFRQTELGAGERTFQLGTDFLKQIMLEFYLC